MHAPLIYLAWIGVKQIVVAQQGVANEVEILMRPWGLLPDYLGNLLT